MRYKIIYWEKEGIGVPEYILYVNHDELDNVIQFCRMKGLKKYCIFNERGKNVCNDGKKTTIKDSMENKELESNKVEEYK
jgi:hypothetical protein